MMCPWLRAGGLVQAFGLQGCVLTIDHLLLAVKQAQAWLRNRRICPRRLRSVPTTQCPDDLNEDYLHHNSMHPELVRELVDRTWHETALRQVKIRPLYLAGALDAMRLSRTERHSNYCSSFPLETQSWSFPSTAWQYIPWRPPSCCQPDRVSATGMGASASGNGRSVGGPCGRACITSSSRPASLLLSLSQTSEFGPRSLYLLLRLRAYVVSQPYDKR